MTNKCPTDQQLSAYHDGELPSADRAEMARHLAWCDVCVLQLSQLRQMSGLLTSMAPEGLSQIAWHRLHAKLDEVLEPMLERGLVRWAWEVSAIAAAILLISSVCLMRISDPKNTNPSINSAANVTAIVPPWVNAQASADPVLSEPATTPAQAWYLADARGSSEVAP